MKYKSLNNIVGWVAFAISAFVYLSTIEPTASWWDCGEYIATAYKLEIGHPPGNSMFLMIARFFTLFAPSIAKIPVMVNSMSALCSAFTILFLFWTITIFARKLFPQDRELTMSEKLVIMGSGLVGSLGYCFTDSFWFSAVEGEVYAMSAFFTAIVIWVVMKWDVNADRKDSVKWIILVAYLMGLSIGVHLLNLLTIPALTYVFYFRKYKPEWQVWILYALQPISYTLAFVTKILKIKQRPQSRI